MSEPEPDRTRASREGEEFAQRLARGLSALASLREVAIGTTPKDAVYREDKLVLYRYRPLSPKAPGRLLADEQRSESHAFRERLSSELATKIRTPVLVCYALVNRPYMLDLQPDRSLIRGLLARGVDVYLIDWGYPDGADRYLDMNDYVLGYLARCVEFVSKRHALPAINLLGVCQGGTMSLCYASLEPERIRNLVTMVTPVDFRTPENLLTKWAERIDLDALVQATGNVPGELLNALFLSLMPYRLTSQKYVGLLDQVDDPRALENFLRMEKWIFDSPDQAGAMFREFISWMVRENRLAAGTLELGGRRVDLQRLRMPLLNVYAMQDHLVPPSASRPLRELAGTADYTAHEFQGGHIGIYVSGAAQREIPERIAGWLVQRDG